MARLTNRYIPVLFCFLKFLTANSAQPFILNQFLAVTNNYFRQYEHWKRTMQFQSVLSVTCHFNAMTFQCKTKACRYVRCCQIRQCFTDFFTFPVFLLFGYFSKAILIFKKSELLFKLKLNEFKKPKKKRMIIFRPLKNDQSTRNFNFSMLFSAPSAHRS